MTRQPGFRLLYQDWGPNAILNRLETEANHNHPDQRRAVPAPGPRPCDASCQKSPPDASQDLFPPPQPIETEELKTR